jgi:hypothetical protein
MTGPRLSRSELEARIAACQLDYQTVKARVAKIGFICEGSLVERWTRCGKPNCRCAEPAGRHGPYYQLSWKEHGRTVSRRLTADDARLYREWIANRHQLDALVNEMKALSRQAGQYLLDGAAMTGPAPDTPAGD